MISKYDVRIEVVHFGYTLESAVLVINNIEFFSPIHEDLWLLSKKFKETMGRFVHKKRNTSDIIKRKTVEIFHTRISHEASLRSK
jgi:hypothetical protein